METAFAFVCCIIIGVPIVGGMTPFPMTQDMGTAAYFAVNVFSIKQFLQDGTQFHVYQFVDIGAEKISSASTAYNTELFISDQHGNLQHCKFIVFWTSHGILSLAKSNCTKNQTTVDGAGLPNSHIMTLFNMAVEGINKMTNLPSRLSATNITSITRQDIYGTKFTFDLTLSESNCTNNQENMGSDLSRCPLNDDSTMTPWKYHVVGLWQSWLSPQYRIVSLQMEI